MEYLTREQIQEAERKAIQHASNDKHKLIRILDKIGDFICILAITGALLIIAYLIVLRIVL